MNLIKKHLVNPFIIQLGKKIEKKHFSKSPIFILGAPRSGTTLLLSILSANPSLFSIPKQTYAFDRWTVQNGKEYPGRIDRLYREIIFRRIPVTAERWIEKTPKHVQNLGKILMYFTYDIKVVHIIRDGRDVVTSSHPAYLDRRYYWVSPERWTHDVSYALRLSDKYKNIYNIKYEDIISNYDTEIRKLCNFLEEPFVDQYNDWTSNTKIKKSIHWGDKVQKIHSNSVARWKKIEHAKRLKEFMNNPQAVELLTTLGYV